jgi:hypothetical protein
MQGKEILLNLNMNCWNSTSNAQGSRVSIVIVQEGAVKIYVAVVEALRKKERGDETQFITKIGGETSLGSSYFVCKISFPVTSWCPIIAKTGRSRPLIAWLYE